MNWKNCPWCTHRLNETALKCPICGYDFVKSNNMNRNTRKINKNGLSFECPDYYDIGNFSSSDEVHKSIVALSKNDRACELYVMEYKDYAFDNNAKRNPFIERIS